MSTLVACHTWKLQGLVHLYWTSGLWLQSRKIFCSCEALMLAWTQAQLLNLDFFFLPFFQLLWNLTVFFTYETKKIAENVPPRVQGGGSRGTRALDSQHGKFQAKPVLLFSGLRKLSAKHAFHWDKAGETSHVGMLWQVVVKIKFLYCRSKD